MLNACNLQHSPLLPSLLFVRWALHTSCIHDNVLTPARLTFCSRATTKRNMAFSIPPPVSVSVHPLSPSWCRRSNHSSSSPGLTPSLDLHALFPRLKAGKGGKGSRITSPIPQLTKNLLKNPPKVGMAGDIPRSRPPTRRQPATSVRTSLLSFQLPLPLPPPPPHLSLSLSRCPAPPLPPPVVGEEGCLRDIAPAVAVGLSVVVTAVAAVIAALGRF